MVTSFKYLGRLILATDYNWPAVMRKLDRAKKFWSRMLLIVSREGASPWVSRFFFKAVIQAVLIFREETWVVTPLTGKALGGFQTHVARRMMGQLPRRTTERKWRYTSAAAARKAAGFLTMEEYFRQCQNTAAHYIAT